MVKNNQLLRTNILVSVILVIGFMLMIFFGYRANYQASLSHIEKVSSLSTDGIYHRISELFTEPVHISLTMANDTLLAEHLAGEPEHIDDAEYIQKTEAYLETYRELYHADSVFLVSAATGRYYNFNGMDRVLREGSPENRWYYDLLDGDQDYAVDVDRDVSAGADNAVTVFVDCKVRGADGSVAGVVGVGVRSSHLREMLLAYEEKFDLDACLIGDDATSEISTEQEAAGGQDWFEKNGEQEIRAEILGWKDDARNLEFWSPSVLGGNERSYVAARYVPELSWHLIVRQDTGKLIEKIKSHLYKTCAMILIVILIVLVVITSVIRNFNFEITRLVEEKQAIFKRATERLYDDIYELNLTGNCYVGKRAEQYFESVGARGLPYDEGLRVTARKQIKEEFREGYLAAFSSENVIREYENGNNHLQYDFMASKDGQNYVWTRIDAYIFYSEEDHSIHMFAYRKNIDEEKRAELLAETDEMTGFLTKTATERAVGRLIEENPGKAYVFIILDIDNFKKVNDSGGHAFGDYCIREFTAAIRRCFRSGDVLGRVGGDEFAAFIPIPDEGWARKKVAELSRSLAFRCSQEGVSQDISASIGAAIASEDGSDFQTLYKNADTALYRIKKDGKNGFSFFRE